MKSVILADTHFGVRLDDDRFIANMEKFYTSVVFPYMKEHGITHIIHVGDVFDNRYKLNMETLRRVKKFFFDEIVWNDITMDIIVGNHDMYFADSMKTLAVKNVLKEYLDGDITIYDAPTMIQYGKIPLMYIPWICAETREATNKMIAESVNSQTVGFGHLQIVGYKQYSTSYAVKGDEPTTFKDFRHVYTGHFHHKNSSGNITYLGSTSHHTWSDEPDTRGFHVFDHDTGEMEFIENPYPLFKSIEKSEIDNLGIENINNLFLRVRYNVDEYDKTLFDLLTKQNYSVEFIPNKLSQDQAENDFNAGEVDVETVGTIAIIEESVSEEAVKEKLIFYYNKAHSEKNVKN